jgi:hypothetical protein
MTTQRVQNLVDASCGFMCGFLFMSFACLKGHCSDAAFVAAISFLAFSFGFSLLQNIRSAQSCERKITLSVSALVPLAALFFYSLLMVGSSYNSDPKPMWMIASLALSLGVISTRVGMFAAPGLCTTLDRRLVKR